ncbi:winged helix-turn-helix transcriptional regulator [Eubacterium aggregans]|uniref:winged helix-turn-helix transcriptional regulator n=1 Tax=Eubacterium aggregans TaxID=81409 RepID=UPI003F3CF46F
MAQIKENYSCVLQLSNDLIGGKWKLRILWHVLKGENRFSSLLKGIPDITKKVLATQLKEMEQQGLLDRKIERSKPLKVTYTTTPQCRITYPHCLRPM